MSNLNVNNIDVQRIINVLNELNNKMQICSFLTYRTMENIENNMEAIKERIVNKEFFIDLERHFNFMKEFRVSHIEIKEEEKEFEKNSELKDDDNLEEEEGDAPVKEKEIKEREDLIGIEEKTSQSTQDLAKSTRSFCRKYHKEMFIIKEMKIFRLDPELNKFCDNFTVFLDNYIKKTKMTLEEEESEKGLNINLKAKIHDLENQIRTKTIK